MGGNLLTKLWEQTWSFASFILTIPCNPPLGGVSTVCLSGIVCLQPHRGMEPPNPKEICWWQFIFLDWRWTITSVEKQGADGWVDPPPKEGGGVMAYIVRAGKILPLSGGCNVFCFPYRVQIKSHERQKGRCQLSQKAKIIWKQYASPNGTALPLLSLGENQRKPNKEKWRGGIVEFPRRTIRFKKNEYKHCVSKQRLQSVCISPESLFSKFMQR